ncbi:MAG: hypothetical protein LBD86_01775 [Spirochaetaceae bacterium]|nr:hypothetical protein [Spirochaetaceae bacterium]
MSGIALTASHANDSYFRAPGSSGRMTPDQGYRTQAALTPVAGLPAMNGGSILPPSRRTRPA